MAVESARREIAVLRSARKSLQNSVAQHEAALGLGSLTASGGAMPCSLAAAGLRLADVVGYSRLVGRDEARTVAALKAHRRELIDREIAGRGGRLVSAKGDGVLAEFPSVVAAVEGAVAIQRAMADRNRDIPPEGRIEFRIGVHLDEVLADGDDILGEGVNVAARLEAFADPGTVCLSGAVFNRVKNRVDYPFHDLGAQRFKNIAEPVRLFRVDPSDDGAQGPRTARGSEALPLPEKPSIAVLPLWT